MLSWFCTIVWVAYWIRCLKISLQNAAQFYILDFLENVNIFWAKREKNTERFREWNWCDLEKFDSKSKENGVSSEFLENVNIFWVKRGRNIERFRELNWCDLEKFDSKSKENGVSSDFLENVNIFWTKRGRNIERFREWN